MPKKISMIVAYDISSNSGRSKVHSILKEWRIDGQKSVAECALTYWEAQELLLQLGEHLDPQTDRLFITVMDPRRARRALGLGETEFRSLMQFG